MKSNKPRKDKVDPYKLAMQILNGIALREGVEIEPITIEVDGVRVYDRNKDTVSAK